MFLTLTYLFAIGIGMLFNHYKYSAFNINIFDYATVFDFLIAPFADFRILLITLVTINITYLLYLGDKYWQEHYPQNYTRFTFNIERFTWYRKIKRSFSLFLFLLLPFSSCTWLWEICKKRSAFTRHKFNLLYKLSN